MPESAAHGGPRDVLPKLALVALWLTLWLATYKFFNNWNADPVRAIRLERPVDLWPGVIQPWTAFVYVFAGYCLPLAAFAWNWSWPRLRFVLAVYTGASLIGFVCYWLAPLAIARPPFVGDSPGAVLMRAVVAVDNDANCCPSFHTTFALLAALLIARGGAGRGVRGVVWASAVGVCISTVTTGQHYVIDVLGGLVLTAVAYLGVAWLWGPLPP